MKFDLQTGDRGVLVDLATGRVVPDAVRGDTAKGWYERNLRNEVGAFVSRPDGLGWQTERIKGRRLRWIPSPRPGQDPLPLSERFWEMQAKGGFIPGVGTVS